MCRVVESMRYAVAHILTILACMRTARPAAASGFEPSNRGSFSGLRTCSLQDGGDRGGNIAQGLLGCVLERQEQGDGIALMPDPKERGSILAAHHHIVMPRLEFSSLRGGGEQLLVHLVRRPPYPLRDQRARRVEQRLTRTGILETREQASSPRFRDLSGVGEGLYDDGR